MIESGSISLLRPDHSLEILHGAALPEEVRAVLPELAGKRPAARKMGERLLASAPVGAAGWAIWLFEKMPEDTSLPDLLKAVQKQSLEMVPQPAPPPAENPAKDMLDAAATAAPVPRKNRIPLFLSSLMTNGAYGEPFVARMRAGKARKFWFGNRTHADAADELRQIAAAQSKAGASLVVFKADAVEEDALDGALLCQKLGVGTLALQLPEDPKNGFAFFATDPKPGAENGLPDAPALIDLLQRGGKAAGKRPASWRRAIFWTALIALVIFLAWPVPLKISSTGQSIPASAVTAALTTGAYLEQTMVRPGDEVRAGDILATFRSPELEQQKAEEELNEMVEKINAQEALAQGNYAEFQLAEQRGSISTLRLKQLAEKIDQLTVRAPVDGRVTDALPVGMRGRYIQPGMAVAEIQDNAKFDLLVEVAGLDAPLLKPGQQGQVYFRGLSEEIYPVEVMSEPVLRQDQNTGTSYLEMRARIVGGDQEKLLVGLSGFVKIEVGQEPNIVALTRYAVEYVRLFVWKYLGLHV